MHPPESDEGVDEPVVLMSKGDALADAGHNVREEANGRDDHSHDQQVPQHQHHVLVQHMRRYLAQVPVCVHVRVPVVRRRLVDVAETHRWEENVAWNVGA